MEGVLTRQDHRGIATASVTESVIAKETAETFGTEDTTIHAEDTMTTQRWTEH